MHSTWHSALDPFEACDEIGEIMETLLGDMAGDSFALSWYGFRYILHNWLDSSPLQHHHQVRQKLCTVYCLSGKPRLTLNTESAIERHSARKEGNLRQRQGTQSG
jgi:hypothetical protein